VQYRQKSDKWFNSLNKAVLNWKKLKANLDDFIVI
jgi:hypothetical protein